MAVKRGRGGSRGRAWAWLGLREDIFAWAEVGCARGTAAPVPHPPVPTRATQCLVFGDNWPPPSGCQERPYMLPGPGRGAFARPGYGLLGPSWLLPSSPMPRRSGRSRARSRLPRMLGEAVDAAATGSGGHEVILVQSGAILAARTMASGDQVPGWDTGAPCGHLRSVALRCDSHTAIAA